jgi:hypothetical protein
MKTNTNTQAIGALKSANNRSTVTIFGLMLVMALSQSSIANAAVPGRRAVNINPRQAQALANQVLNQIAASGALAPDETTTRDGEAHLCAEEPTCVAKKMTKELRRAGFATKTVVVTPTKGSPGVRIMGPKGEPGEFPEEAAYDKYVVTSVRLVGGQKVIDPVTLHSANLMPFKDWRKRIFTPVTIDVLQR